MGAPLCRRPSEGSTVYSDERELQMEDLLFTTGLPTRSTAMPLVGPQHTCTPALHMGLTHVLPLKGPALSPTRPPASQTGTASGISAGETQVCAHSVMPPALVACFHPDHTIPVLYHTMYISMH